jgi:hypothetical protein
MTMLKNPGRRLTCSMLLMGLLGPAFSADVKETLPLGQLSGTYGNGIDTFTFQADGRFTWVSVSPSTGSDPQVGVKAAGRASSDAKSIFLVLDKDSFTTLDGGPVPFETKGMDFLLKLHPVEASNQLFLLREDEINSIVNLVNRSSRRQPVDASPYLRRLAPGGMADRTLKVAPAGLVPAAFAGRILKAPLQGKLLTIGKVVEKQVNTGERAGPAGRRTQYAAPVTIDLGSSQGVFRDMRLYVGSARYEVEVSSVQADTCKAVIVWFETAPQVGDRVSSAID